MVTTNIKRIDFKSAIIGIVPKVEKILLDDVQNNFKNERDPFLNAWKPRKDSLPHPILNKTGKLKNSIEAISPYDVEGIIEIYLNTDVPYGLWHMTGTAKMPARQYLGVTEKAWNEIKKEIKNL